MVSLIREFLDEKVVGYRARAFEPFPACFVVSTGRTGTQFFESFFNNHFPQVFCRHEPAPDGFEVSISKIRSNMDTGKIVCWLRANRSEIFSLLKKHGAKLYVESNPFLSLLIPEVRAAFPQCRFVWIVRDPKTYVVSAYNKSPVGDNVMFFYADNDHRKRMTALDFPQDRWHKRWPEFDRFQKICWYWNKCNEILERDFGNRDDVLLIKFEDMFNPNDRRAGMFRVLDFFGINGRERLDQRTLDLAMNSATNSADRVLLQNVENWTSKQKLDFDELTSPMRRRLGYV